jgi:hypothetical protein
MKNLFSLARSYLAKFWQLILIICVVVIFFFPVFKGQVPFPGDLLVGQAPFKAEGYLGYAPGGYPNKAQGPDVINEIYPWRYFLVNQLRQGQIPFWNPHNFSGNPQMANFQTAIFYPFNILYLMLPFNLSWTLLIILQPLLAAVFMYLFLKKGLGLKDIPSVLGGIAFGFSSYMTVWIEYGNIGATILWLPLTLLFTKSFFNNSSFRNFFGIVASLFLAILAGYIQGIFYTILIAFFYYLYLIAVQKQLKNFKLHSLFLLALFLPVLLSAFQILPTLKLFSDSTRGNYSLLQIQKNLAPILYWITAFVPDFFGNPASRNYWLDGTYIERVLYPSTLMMFFGIFALTNKIKIVEKKFFAILALISLIIATNLPLVKYFYLIPIPVISTTIPTREFSVFIFSVIILGSIGINHFLETKKINKLSLILYVVFIICIWGLVLLLIKLNPQLTINLKVSLRNLILPTLLFTGIIFSVLIFKINKKIFIILITLILVSDLFFFFNKITPFSPKELIYPKTLVMESIRKISGINRFWGYGTAYVPANFQSVDQTFSPEGNDPLHTARYGELLASSRDGKYPVAVPRPDANIASGYGADDLKTNIYRQRILNLLGVKFILHEQNLASAWNNADINTFPEKDFKLVKKIFPWQIYENKNALPRFFVTSNFKIAKDKYQALSLIYDQNIDLKKTLILESNEKIIVDKNSIGTSNLILYTPNKVVIRTKASGNSLLFLSDNFYPEWKVNIDGKNSQILVADYAFRAVVIPKGNHTVEFYYQPAAFIYGLIISFVGLSILFVYGIISWNVKKYK